jgi:hypothetical protein
MNLAGTAAAAQTNDEDTTTQREQAENWNYYQQSTRVPPAELQARMQADTTQRELADRWTYYYHATRMSPAELKAWTQAKDRAGTSTEPPAQAAAPVPPGQPGWLVVSLGCWRRRWRSSLDWPWWPPGAPTAGLGSGRRPDNGHALAGAAAPTRQPHRLAGDRLLAYFADGHGSASVR